MYTRLLRYHTFITALFAFALILGFDIVYHEYTKGGICVKFLSIPTCYLIVAMYVLAFLAHLMPIKKVWKLYFVPLLLVIIIGIIESLLQLIAFISPSLGCPSCPTTYFSIPACIASLIIACLLFRYKIKLVWYTD